jgi:hypothetical protein
MTRPFTKPLVRMMGQSVGPVFGGIISNYLGFHAIFWFLFGLGALTLLLLLLVLPETLRSIAGNGTIRLTSVHRPLIYSFSPPRDELLERDTTPREKSHCLKHCRTPQISFRKGCFHHSFLRFDCLYSLEYGHIKHNSALSRSI